VLQWWGRRCRLPSRAGPPPLVRGCGQPSRHRIPLNVPDDSIPLLSVAHPVAVRLILPEGMPGEPEQSVGLPRGPGLQPARDGGDGHVGQDQQMYVIGHYHPRGQFVPVSEGFSALNRLRHQVGNAGIAQPLWAGPRVIEGAISRYERVARCGVGALGEDRGERSEEAPGEKDVDVIGLEMGQSATVFEHDTWAGEHRLPHQQQCSALPSILTKMQPLLVP